MSTLISNGGIELIRDGDEKRLEEHVGRFRDPGGRLWVLTKTGCIELCKGQAKGPSHVEQKTVVP